MQVTKLVAANMHENTSVQNYRPVNLTKIDNKLETLIEYPAILNSDFNPAKNVINNG